VNASPQAESPLARLSRALAPNATSARSALTRWQQSQLTQLAGIHLPTPRDDAWKYTSLRTLDRRVLLPAESGADAQTLLDQLPSLGSHRLVLVNGRLDSALSSAHLPAGCTLTRLDDYFLSTAETSFAGDANHIEDRLRFVNACLTQDGLCLDIAPGTHLDAPIEIILLATGQGAYPRIVVSVGAGAHAQLLEQHRSAANADSVTLQSIDLVIGDRATLAHTTVQESGHQAITLSETRVTLHNEAHYAHQWMALGGQLSRLDLKVSLEGRGAHADLSGLFFADGTREQHVRTRLDHTVAHTSSDQRYRGVAAGRGRGSYDGKIVVHKDAQKTTSNQSSRNLLLSPGAEINTRPQLEICADDVKCSHGATTGTLDKNMEFYLLSRGLDRSAARALLTFAFIDDVLRKLSPSELRTRLEAAVLARLPDAALLREFVT